MKKLLYGINTTTNKKNDICDNADFITDTIKVSLESDIKNCFKQGNDILNRHSKLVFFSMYIGGIALLSTIFTYGIYDTQTQNHPNTEGVLKTILFVAIVIFVPCLVIFIINIIILIKKMKSDAIVAINAKIEELYNLAAQQLDISSSAIKMDIINTKYVLIGTKRVIKKYDNVDSILWRDNDTIKISNLHYIVSISLESISSVEKVKKKIKFIQWHKEMQPRKGKFKKFKISTKNDISFIIKYIYIITIEKNGIDYELIIPNYEIDSFKNLTGLIIST